MKKFLYNLGTFLVVLILAVSPLWFGLPEGREIQSIVETPTFSMTGFDSVMEMLANWFIFFTNNSLPSVYLHYTLMFLGLITFLAMLFKYQPKVFSRGIMYGGIGWGAIMAGMLYAESDLPDAFKNYDMCANFMLYGIWYIAVAIFLDSQNRREYALFALMFTAMIVCYWSMTQYQTGLGDLRQMYASKEGFESFTAFTNSVMQTSIDPRLELTIRKLSSQRVFGTFVYPNALGGFLIIIIPITLSFVMSSKKNMVRLFAFLVLAITIFTLMLSRSKASIGIVTMVVLSLLYYARLGKSISNKAWIATSFLTIAAGILMLKWGYGARLAGRLQATGGARIDYWQAAIAIIKDNPIKGWGSGGFTRNYLAYCRPGAEETRLAHNAYLNIWTDYGLMAFIGLIFTFTIAILQGIYNLKKQIPFNWLSAACTVAAIGFILHCFVDFDFHIPGIVLPGLAALVIGQLPIQAKSQDG